MSEQRHRIAVTPQTRAESPYLEVPFEIADGEESFEVLLDYDGSTGARIDLGCEGPAGWRGWSGGARRRFVIAENAATWGYVPGRIETGRWVVVLGLHVIPADGVELDVVIRTPGGIVFRDPDVAPPVARATPAGRPAFAAPEGLTWFAGDFHAHTLHSDGSTSIRQVAERAVAEGLDFVAVTDHNTISHHASLPGIGAEYGLTMIPGQEVTTGRGHANAFGDIRWVDFRTHPDAWVAQVAEDGGVLSINHPVSGDCAWQWALAERPTHAEVFHSSWLAAPTDRGAWSWWHAWGTGAIPLGGSDFHYPESGLRPGLVTTWVAATDVSVDALLDGVRAGRTAMSRSVGPAGGIDGVPVASPVLLRVGDELVAYGAAGCVLIDGDGRQWIIGDDVFRAAASDTVYRLETPAREILALVGRVPAAD
ncbi:CehA/McbA family metallohydrolase [Plantibacter sp. YIM 135249]|uniref:CehA/McbA family metallohydrolase n=1 Tax=Plantibacter sp. YIM 135249 TaxID=3423918 RepID=UPI003D325B6F